MSTNNPMTPQGIEGAVRAAASEIADIPGAYIYTSGPLSEIIRRHINPAVQPLVEAAEAALRYDAAIAACGNDPDRMATARTAQGDDLDALYEDWINKSRAALETWRRE